MSREALIQHPPFNLTSQDIATLQQKDEDFVPYKWAQLRDIINLENYIHFTYHIQATYGSIIPFILQHKLSWVSSQISPSEVASLLPLRPADPRPFASPQDFKVRRNDWPYGTEGHIKHLVVWLKTPIDVDGDGEPSTESRALIEDFVDRTFRARMSRGKDSVMWFRNPTKWQTVRAVEHFHVLVCGADEDLLESWTDQTQTDIEVQKWKNGKKTLE
nr:n-acetylglucosamine-induced protein 1 [Quercus suber]